mgnify:CR=1 FL=1
MVVERRDRFLRACRSQPVDCTPVWLMRQAGRYLPEYRLIRERHPMLEVIKAPDLAVEITLQPLARFDVDAAIIFSDILPPLESLGVEVQFAKGNGPIIPQPVRAAQDVLALRAPDAEEIAPYTLQAIRLASRELSGRLPLIGFSGAPFTLASYLIEGGSSRDYSLTKRFMYHETAAWHALMDKLARLVGAYLSAQVRAGAQAVQVFDSWAGALGAADYREFVLPYARAAVERPRGTGVPVIYFSTGTGGILEDTRATGADVIGVDWRVDLGSAWRRLGQGVAVQGNLDPQTLLAPVGRLRQRAAEVLQAAGGRPGHIFNLGHGVLPETPPEQVAELVDFVHHQTANGRLAACHNLPPQQDGVAPH